MKPKGLAETTLAMCIMNIAGLVFVDPRLAPVGIQYAIFGVIIAFTYLVLWFYWKGKNWARILVLLTGILSILNLYTFSSENILSGALLLIEAVFGAFMLWWLNVQNVRAYFKPATEPNSN